MLEFVFPFPFHEATGDSESQCQKGQKRGSGSRRGLIPRSIKDPSTCHSFDTAPALEWPSPDDFEGVADGCRDVTVVVDVVDVDHVVVVVVVVTVDLIVVVVVVVVREED